MAVAVAHTPESHADSRFKSLRGAGLAFLVMVIVGCSAEDSASTDSANTDNSRDIDSETTSTIRWPAGSASASGQSQDSESGTLEPVELPGLSEDKGQGTSSSVDSGTSAANPGEIIERNRLLPIERDLNADRLSSLGINRYQSKRLVLYSDSGAEKVQGLPAVADKLYEALVAYFGELPPALDGSEFRVTGYLVSDRSILQQADLLPVGEFTVRHGRHLGYEFWMINPEDDYYRQHLALHEFTHCFMTCATGLSDQPPLWYVEGMAEYFATHEADEFGVLPDDFENFEGWGRITAIQQRNHEFGVPTLRQLQESGWQNGYSEVSDYASGWALCWLLNHHPVYRDAFRAVPGCIGRAAFRNSFEMLLKEHGERLSTDARLFLLDLEQGYQADLAFPRFADEVQAAGAGQSFSRDLPAAAGWVSTGLILDPGLQVKIAVQGTVTLALEPKPWLAEPQGVSIRYYRGRPLGMAIGLLIPADPDSLLPKPFAIGPLATRPVDERSELWLRVNDSAAELRDNDGAFSVVIDVGRQEPGEEAL